MWHGDKKICNKQQAYESFANALTSKDGLMTIRNIKKDEFNIDDRVTQVNYHTFTVLTPHPSTAEITGLNTRRDMDWSPQKLTGSSVTRNSFKKIFGKR